MPRNRLSFCPETCTRAPTPAQWDTRFLGKPFHTLRPGMEWWKEKPLARWNDAERQSARRGRRVICRLVREPREQATAWVPKLENEPACSHFYCITSCLLAHCLFGRFFLAFFPLYSGGSDTRLSHPR